MCQMYPGNRCSSHGKKVLAAAQERLDKAVAQIEVAPTPQGAPQPTPQQVSEIVRLKTARDNALREYYTTVAGLKELQSEAERARSRGDTQKADELDIIHRRSARVRAAHTQALKEFKEACRQAELRQEHALVDGDEALGLQESLEIQRQQRAEHRKALSAYYAIVSKRPLTDDETVRAHERAVNAVMRLNMADESVARARRAARQASDTSP